ncbi:Zinc knuckle CX2CX4HX4C [Sesbania bispinosa]|nr:Zinc knuckle CX2CX4HX4C [Sesbania bispinosa]
MGFKIGASIGEVFDSELFETKEKGSFIKIMVCFDTTKPLKPGIHVGSKSDGVSWVDFLYEKIPQFCYSCGLVGHDEDGCSQQTGENKKETDAPMLGPWLRATQWGRKASPSSKAADYKCNSHPNKPKQAPLPNEVLSLLSSLSVTKKQSSPSKKATQVQLEPAAGPHKKTTLPPAVTISEFEVLQQEHVTVVPSDAEAHVEIHGTEKEQRFDNTQGKTLNFPATEAHVDSKGASPKNKQSARTWKRQILDTNILPKSLAAKP